MRLSFSVDAPPPDRSEPGRSADRYSPGAAPLVEVVQRIIGSDPGHFPVVQPLGITVVFGRTRRSFPSKTYGPIDPILEVLEDTGVIADVRQALWEHQLQGADDERYTVTIEAANAN